MIELCAAPALVLLDEVGTGTDPEEGSALGVAVVDHFRRVCGAHVIATTHYGGLKMYAANEEGVLNASVEFDEKTLRPTYRDRRPGRIVFRSRCPALWHTRRRDQQCRRKRGAR
jgi:DNA mismatch repair protein MutS2